MSRPMTDEEVAAGVDAQLSGERGRFISTCTTERDRRMVAAGRAEELHQMLQVAELLPADKLFADAIRARLRELEGEK